MLEVHPKLALSIFGSYSYLELIQPHSEPASAAVCPGYLVEALFQRTQLKKLWIVDEFCVIDLDRAPEPLAERNSDLLHALDHFAIFVFALAIRHLCAVQPGEPLSGSLPTGHDVGSDLSALKAAQRSLNSLIRAGSVR